MHEIKQAVNYMGPELLLRNAPPPPESNFVHFYEKEVLFAIHLFTIANEICHDELNVNSHTHI